MATARKLPSGNYRVQVFDHVDDNGKRIYKSFTGPTKKEAEFMAAEYMSGAKSNIITSERLFGESVIDYCNLKSNVLSPATLREYRRMEKTYFGQLRNVPLKKITPDLVQRWVNSFSADHSPKTVRNAHGLLSAVLDTFVPGIQLKTAMPQKQASNLYVPSDSDINAILQYFLGNDKDMAIAVYLAAFGTLRRSEICGLDASDIKGSVVYVSKAMVDAGNSDWITKTTKTVSSTRRVEMPSFVISLFPTTGPLVSINPDQITHRFARAFRKLNIHPFRFHDLRHYAASIMHAIGVPDQYIMQRGGWSSDKTLKNIYRGTIEDYEKKYTNVTLGYFETMQHEMQHRKQKTPKTSGL